MNNQPPTKSITIRAWRSLTTAIKTTAAKSFSFGGGLGTVGFGSGARSVGGVELRDLTHRADEMDYGKMLGDVWDSSIMSIVLNWFWRTFPEAPCVVQRRNEDDRWEAEHDHPLALLLNHPHDFFTPSQLWDMILLGYMLNGNAYLLKNRNAAGEVVELIPIPHWQIEPWWEEGDYITAYRYFPTPSGTETFTDFSPRDIIHFKNGFDPTNWRKGLAPWRAQKVLLVTDKECDFYESTVLHNRGLPSVVITPADNSTFIDKDNSEKIKTMWIARTTGKERGKPLVLSDPFKLQELGLNPTQMMVDKLRQPSETRVSAAYGIPSAILGLMAGIENCLPAETRISTVKRGPVPIKDVEEGDLVWSLTGGRLQEAMVVWSGYTGTKPVYKLKTQNRTIRATDNHPFLTRRQQKVKVASGRGCNNPQWRYWLDWVALKDLKPGDVIVEPIEVPDSGGDTMPTGEEATYDKMQWLGAFVGDGCHTFSKGGGFITMCIPKEDRVRDEYFALTLKVCQKYQSGGARPWKQVRDGSTGQMVAQRSAGDSWRQIAKDHSVCHSTVQDRVYTALNPKPVVMSECRPCECHNGFRLGSKSTCLWVMELGFKQGAKNKSIPGWVFGLKEPLRMAFLRGLLDTDGTVDKRGHATFNFASQRLTEDIWHLALGLGMSVSNIYHQKVSTASLPNPCKQEWTDAWRFKICSQEDVSRIGTQDPKYRVYLAEANEKKRPPSMCLAPKSANILPANCQYVKVQSIAEDGVEDVYDLTVADAHNFVANGLIVHNSTLANVQTWWTYSYLSGIMPLQRRLAETLTFHLLSEFIPTGDVLTKPGIHVRVAFDTSEVYALQQQKDDLYQRNTAGFRGGVLKRSEARSNLVLKVDRAREDVYIEDVMPQQLGLGPGHSDTVSGAASGTQPTNGTHGGDGVPASQKAIMDLMGSLK